MKKIILLTMTLVMGMTSLSAQNQADEIAEELKIVKAPIEKVDRTPVVFKQQENGFILAGILYRPRNRKPNEKLKAVIVNGPMYSVMEQTQSIYAQFLAEAGYATLVFDHSYIGASEGHPRGYEDPEIKGADTRSAVTFLQSLDFINKDHIGAVGICGSGVYVPNGLRNDTRVKAIVSVVPFIMMTDIKTNTDEELIKMKQNYENGGEVVRLDLIKGSEGEAYYRNVDRGAAVQACPTPAWSQLAWHKFHPTETVKELKVPYLVIAGEKAFTREGSELMFKNAPEPKFFHLTKGASHFEMYDMEKYVNENIEEILKFFENFL
jgi:fermentation-respiration switch protein FrsA (DUF1100 family)